MKDAKLVSINITTFNRAHLISRCIDSILRQSYENIEVIVVDDCSSDNTEIIMHKYTNQDSRIKYFRHNQNKKNAYTRNTALKNCSGYYVAFMDDDDEWIDPDKLKKQVKIFECDKNNKIGIVCTNPRIYHNEHNYTDKMIEHPTDLKSRILIGNSMIYNSTCLTKREIMFEVGGFDTNLPKGIDSDFFRNMIVNFNYDVYFMQEITTAVHEYGDDRMTPTVTTKAILKNINSQEMCLFKYKDSFNKYKKEKYTRKKNIIKQYINLCIKDKTLIYLVNILKLLVKD